jgi:Zn-dependent protease
LACPECHALVHGRELDALSKQAQALEAKGDFAQARGVWNNSLALLPHDSNQAAWVNNKLQTLGTTPSAGADSKRKPDHGWARKLGPLAPIAIFLAKAKGLFLVLFKLKFLLSMFAFVAVYIAMFGWRYGVGITVSILIHEMGHYIDIKRRGLPAEMPVFLPGLGAYVKWNALGVSLRQRAQISLAGPLAGWMAAACCVALSMHTHNPLWAALARTGAVLNVLNLIPIWILDGAKGVNALGMVERSALLAATLGVWLYSGEAIFFLVAAGIVYRLFTKDKPAQEDWSTLIYYAALLAALGMVLHMVPESLFSRAVR